MKYNKQELIDIKLQNYITNLNELLDRKTVLESKPLSVQILLTNICNLNCIVCNFKDYHNGTMLDKKIIENTLKNNPQLITVEWSGGGEPLMHPDFEYFMDLAHFLGIKQILITNGLLLTENIIKKIAQYDVNLVLSVDGHSKEIYEKIRKKANYETLIKKIKILNKYRQEYNSKGFLRIYYIVLKDNYKHLNDMLYFIKEYNINEIFFKTDSTHSEFDIVSHGTIEMKAGLQKNLKEAMSYASEHDINCMIDEGMRQILNMDFSGQNQLIGAEPEIKNDSICLVPWQQVRILPKGDVVPTYFCSVVIGNINANTLNDLWNSDVMVEYRRDILNFNDKTCTKHCHAKKTTAKTHSGMERFLHTLLI